MQPVDYFDRLAGTRDRWVSRNCYYHAQLARALGFFIPRGASILEIGSGTGSLLNALHPGRGLGLDLSPEMVQRAKQNHPHLEFRVDDVERLAADEKFDFVVLSDLIGFLGDVQRSFDNLHQVCTPRTRVLISSYNVLWEPLLRLGERLGWKARQPLQNWLSPADIQNLLELADFEVVRKTARMLLPKRVPLLSACCNRFLVHLPLFRKLALVNLLVARPRRSARASGPVSCSVVIPCRNERGNVEDAVRRTPDLGGPTELIFVEGHSRDGTADEIQRIMAAYPERDIRLVAQGSQAGKGDAVRAGFAAARGDILIILDGDLTVEPETLPKFYDALVTGKGELVQGSRLVYPMEKQAMRFLNMVANKFFSQVFTYLLDQRFKDTLCGTKALFRADYERIHAQRRHFGELDPFGDFDLIFGAARLNLRILEIPVRYRERTYGATQIRRFRHGWLLLQMAGRAMARIKFV
jgi:SAM-dependent methyltransferase